MGSVRLMEFMDWRTEKSDFQGFGSLSSDRRNRFDCQNILSCCKNWGMTHNFMIHFKCLYFLFDFSMCFIQLILQVNALMCHGLKNQILYPTDPLLRYHQDLLPELGQRLPQQRLQQQQRLQRRLQRRLQQRLQQQLQLQLHRDQLQRPPGILGIQDQFPVILVYRLYQERQYPQCHQRVNR